MRIATSMYVLYTVLRLLVALLLNNYYFMICVTL